MLGKLVVAFITARHSHNRACAIAGQHVLANPNRNLFSIKGIDSIRPRECSRNLLHFGHPLYFRATLHILQIFVNFFALLSGSNLLHQVMFRCQHNEVNPKNGIGASGENFQSLIPRPLLRWRRGGIFYRRLTIKLRFKFGENNTQIIFHFIVCESNYIKSFRLQKLSTSLVVLLIIQMILAINFYHQPFVKTNKICNEYTNRMLSSNLKT